MEIRASVSNTWKKLASKETPMLPKNRKAAGATGDMPFCGNLPPVRRWFVVLSVLGWSVLVLCPGERALASQEAALAKDGQTTQAPPTTEVVLLKPLVRFEDPRNDSVLSGYAAQEAAFESHLLGAVKNKIGSKAGVVEPEALSEPAAAEACKQLQSRSSRLARGSIAEEDKENLSHLAALNDRQLVLAQFVRVKAGPGRSWNPNTGSITSAMASTLLQAALVSSKTGQVIWKSEQFIRKALRPETPEFNKALLLLFETLEMK